MADNDATDRDRDMIDPDMSEEKRAEHIEQIAQQFENFRGNLSWLVNRMYTEHFTTDPMKSPEYLAIVEAVDNWERNVLEKYRP